MLCGLFFDLASGNHDVSSWICENIPDFLLPSQMSKIPGGDLLILSQTIHLKFAPRIGDLDKKKYLVPSDLTVGQFYFLIRFCIVCKDLFSQSLQNQQLEIPGRESA